VTNLAKARPRNNNNRNRNDRKNNNKMINNGNTIKVTVTIGLTITVGSHCCAKMTPVHAGCLPPRRKATDLTGPIRCSLLTLEREKHLTTGKQQPWVFRFSGGILDRSLT
jgi:hypothetical protein